MDGLGPEQVKGWIGYKLPNSPGWGCVGEWTGALDATAHGLDATHGWDAGHATRREEGRRRSKLQLRQTDDEGQEITVQ